MFHFFENNQKKAPQTKVPNIKTTANAAVKYFSVNSSSEVKAKIRYIKKNKELVKSKRSLLKSTSPHPPTKTVYEVGLLSSLPYISMKSSFVLRVNL